MGTETIRIQVDAEAARAYRSTPAGQRHKLDALLSLRLKEAVRPEVSLEELMREISARALRQGLTQDGLADLLQDG
jgi:hypothetical protein